MVWVVAGAVVALVAFFAVKGMQAAKREKAEAPQHLKAAQDAFSKGDQAATLRELAAAFVETEHYSADDAKVALEAVALTEKLALQRGTNIQDVTTELKAGLGAAAASPSGADVVTDYTATFKKFITRAAREPEKLVDALTSSTTKFVT